MTHFDSDEYLDLTEKTVRTFPEPEKTMGLIKIDYARAHSQFRKAIVRGNLDLSVCQRHLDKMFEAVEKLPKSRHWAYFIPISESIDDLLMWRFGRPEPKRHPRWYQYFPNAVHVWLWRNFRKPDLLELTKYFERIDIVDHSKNL
jgi:hypothetical protein